MCSGQMINQEKSLITFGSRIHGHTQERLKRVLGINNHGGGGKYLGLPEQFGRKKKEMFNYIVDKVRQRTSSWSAKYLSPAGKEILLKSVALAMPVYAMSCFKLPNQVISELDSLMLQFWWEKSEHQHGIPWVAWKKLQISKKEGGLGFRNLEQFNDALLAKQAWRLLQKPDSVFAKLFKSRYYRDDHLFQAKSHKNQSFGWSSILVGIKLLKQGCSYIIGNGRATKIFKDAWIPTEPPRPAELFNQNEDMMVCDLIKTQGTYRVWNEEEMDRVLSGEDKELVRRIYLAQKEEDDKLVWHNTSHGQYSVKTGYNLAMKIYNAHHQPVMAPHGNIELKNQVWNLPIMPKLKHFIWRILSKAIGTSTRLNTRGIRIDKICQRCCADDESINHLIFTCPISRQTWRLSQLPYMFQFRPTYDVEENIKFLLTMQNDKNLTKAQKILPFWVMWRIWKSRNDLLFNKKPILPLNDIEIANTDVYEWILNNSPPSKRNFLTHKSLWTRPGKGWFKCNYDASFNQANNKAFAGWILRDEFGVAKFWGSSNLNHTSSPLEAESKTLLVAIQNVWFKGYRKVIFEGDCQILVNSLIKNHEEISILNICQDIKVWERKFEEIRFEHVLRSNNEAAHLLARNGPQDRTFYSSCIYPPVYLTNRLYQDFICSN